MKMTLLTIGLSTGALKFSFEASDEMNWRGRWNGGGGRELQKNLQGTAALRDFERFNKFLPMADPRVRGVLEHGWAFLNANVRRTFSFCVQSPEQRMKSSLTLPGVRERCFKVVQGMTKMAANSRNSRQVKQNYPCMVFLLGELQSQ